jgi:hypothetical protein
MATCREESSQVPKGEIRATEVAEIPRLFPATSGWGMAVAGLPKAEPRMVAPPRMDRIEHGATSGSSTQSADGNAALRGVGSTELPEATTLAIDSMSFLMEIS